LFDRLRDIVFSIKDRQGRYVLMSEAVVARCRLPSKRHAIGLTAFDLFPAAMAERYTRQDTDLFKSGKPLIDSLDLTVYRDGSAGWCLTCKEPLHDAHGKIVGLACVSRDLDEGCRGLPIDSDFAALIDHMHANYDQPLRVADLAVDYQLTLAQLDRRMRKVFQLSSKQYLLKIRIDAARRLLSENCSIAEVAHLTGFCDQSALSRQFRQLTGLTPSQYRAPTSSPPSPTRRSR
ncbi:MAG: helix-turn-helix domain-containing protein, partial [Rhodanobacter sp.]